MMKHSKAIICIFIVLFVLSACSNKTFENALEQGLSSLEEKNYSKAVSYFEIALEEKSDSKEANSYLEQATLLNDVNDSLKAEDYEKALRSILTLEKLDDVLSVVKNNASDLKEQITKGQQNLVYEEELESIESLIDGEEFDTAKNKLDTLKNVLDNNSDFQEQIEKISKQLDEQKNDQSESKVSQQVPIKEIVIEKQPSSEQKNTFSYKTYTNTRFGFSIQYPTTFTEGPAPTNNDGREFYNDDSSIVASGSHINTVEENETIETYYNRALEYAAGTVSYQRLGNDWFVISYKDGSNTVYEKSIIGDDIISTLVITYPSNKQNDYESMVTQISSTFKGGQTELAW